MSRPADWEWEPLGEASDPVPGDVHDLKVLSKRFGKTAKTIWDTAEDLKKLGNQESWDSEAGDAFAESAKKTRETILKAHDRYKEASEALDDYYKALDDVQYDAGQLLIQAKNEESAKSNAERNAANPPEGTTESEQASLDKKVEEAEDALRELRKKVPPLKKRHDEAGDKAAGRIKSAIEADGLNDGFLDELRDALTLVADIAGAVAAVCGVVALLVGWIPIIGQAIAGILGTIALIATAISLVCHIALYINGDATWQDVAMDVLGIATFGVGRVFSSASKLAATMGRSKVWDAANRFVMRTSPQLNSAQRRARVESMVGKRAGARSWDAATPNVSLGAGFRGLRGSLADDFSTVKNHIGDLAKMGDHARAMKEAWRTGGVRGVASMWTGPGMVDEAGRMTAISRETLEQIGAMKAFSQSDWYAGLAVGATGTGGAMDISSVVGLFEGEPPDVTGSDFGYKAK